MLKRISVNAHNGLQVEKNFPLLSDRFQRNKNILLLSITDINRDPKFLKTRIHAENINRYPALLLREEAKSTMLPNGALGDAQEKPSMFHYSVALDRESKNSRTTR